MIRQFYLVGSLVDVRMHEEYCGSNCSCFPPEDKVRGLDPEYLCDPIPPKTNPPVGHRLLKHLIQSPQCLPEKQDWILRQFPKKRQGELIAENDSTPGWGIYLQEGWDWDKLRYLLPAYLFASLIFAIVWTVCKDDVQGAFGVAGYIVSNAAVFLGWMAMRPV
jgi:hypothetical protein